MSIAKFAIYSTLTQMMKPQGFGDRLAQERRLKAAREGRDVLKKDVAKAVKASESAVGRWEAGLAKPSDLIMERLAVFFGVTPAWLRYGQEPREAPPAPKPAAKPAVDPGFRHRKNGGGQKEA